MSENGEFDPYKVLGVRRNARLDKIKLAWRRRSQETHPDTSGRGEESADEFKQVQLAWEILSNAGRRAKFDADGSYDRQKPNNDHVQVANILSRTLTSVMQSLAQMGRAPEKEDVLGMMWTGLEAVRNQFLEAIEKHRSARRVAEKMLGRFGVADGGENILEATIKSQLDHLDQAIALTKEQMKPNDAAIEELKKYTFRIDPETGAWTFHMLMPGSATTAALPRIRFGGAATTEG